MTNRTFLELPLEIRHAVYKVLFTVLQYPPSERFYNETTENARKEVRSRCAILHTCRQIRNEAFPIFNESVTIVERSVYLHNYFPPIVRGMKTTETGRELSDLKYLVHSLPGLEMIISTVTCRDEVEYDISLAMEDAHVAFCGTYDQELVKQICEDVISDDALSERDGTEPRLFDEVPIVKSALDEIRGGPLTLEFAHSAVCHLQVGESCEVDGELEAIAVQEDVIDAYRIVLDSDDPMKYRREINISIDKDRSQWIAAEKILLLVHKELGHPLLYCPSTGETRQIRWPVIKGLDLRPTIAEARSILEDNVFFEEVLSTAVRCVKKEGLKRKYEFECINGY